jgi:hypothetical protein
MFFLHLVQKSNEEHAIILQPYAHICARESLLVIYLCAAYLKPLLARTRIIKHTAAEQKVAVRVKIYRYAFDTINVCSVQHKNEKLVAV